MIFLSASHSFKMSMGFGKGTENYVELVSLKLLFLFALEKGVNTLQIFGDSMLVIYWAVKYQQCHNLQLHLLLEEVNRILESFDMVCNPLVYMEHNMEAYSLSKSCLQPDLGK